MSVFRDFLNLIRRLFNWWIVVTPWEQVLRVRCGKRIALLEAGIHMRIPFFDQVYRQSIRTRVTELPLQTLTTKDGHTLTTKGMLRYEIDDTELLYRTLHDAQSTVVNMAAGAIAQYVQTHDREDVTPEKVQEEASANIDLSWYGLGNVALELLDFAYVRTYRLWTQDNFYHESSSLNTRFAETSGEV